MGLNDFFLPSFKTVHGAETEGNFFFFFFTDSRRMAITALLSDGGDGGSAGLSVGQQYFESYVRVIFFF